MSLLVYLGAAGQSLSIISTYGILCQVLFLHFVGIFFMAKFSNLSLFRLNTIQKIVFLMGDFRPQELLYSVSLIVFLNNGLYSSKQKQ